ncbi:hypothetical protein [Flavobacterium limi]|uniref:Uncharacterized protein n=1 Tax=Flavobacterium limi TaxID=2045105 RepID=A0ABQ1U9W7_9FLAO|nr:hypothetical protein [Flavobacterium limi]GGF13749.1 hypothetical protein GCM10011518_23740 [Flavobacterium limi]
MKKIIYVLILPLVVVSGLVFSLDLFAKSPGANHEIKNQTSKNSIPKPLSTAEKKAGLKKWEATPDGIMFKKWEASPAGKKVYAAEAKIRKSIKEYSDIEAVITSLSLPPDSRLGFGVMVRINNEDYILAFGPKKSGENNEFEKLYSLKVNDKIIIKSHSVSHAPKYSYPIVSGDYVERNNKTIYKRTPRKGGC